MRKLCKFSEDVQAVCKLFRSGYIHSDSMDVSVIYEYDQAFEMNFICPIFNKMYSKNPKISLILKAIICSNF